MITPIHKCVDGETVEGYKLECFDCTRETLNAMLESMKNNYYKNSESVLLDLENRINFLFPENQKDKGTMFYVNPNK